MSEDFHGARQEVGHERRTGRGRPTTQETELRLTHQIEDLKKENAALRARMADHFFAMSVPFGGA